MISPRPTILPNQNNNTLLLLPFLTSLLLLLLLSTTTSFILPSPHHRLIKTTSPITTNPLTTPILLHSTSSPSPSPSTTTTTSTNLSPQIISTGHSTSPDLLTALTSATLSALSSLPPSSSSSPPSSISLTLVTLSSLYDGQSSTPFTSVIPTILATAGENVQLETIIGCTAGGLISGARNEMEGVPGVVVTMMMLPDVEVNSFYVGEGDVMEDYTSVGSRDLMRRLVGVGGEEEEEEEGMEVMVIPSPAFQNELDTFLRGLSYSLPPQSHIFGGIASTVSSLSRARLFRYSRRSGDMELHGNGCIGVTMRGDLEIRTMVAQGAKPIGDIYRIIAGSESTIRAMVRDETSSDDDAEPPTDPAANQAYQRSLLPQPPLAAANYLMKTLSDDDQALMRQSILVGVENGGAFGRSPNELERLTKGEGHRFTVHRVASAGMKDGSVTLPLKSVRVEVGQRVKFFVRDGAYAGREVECLWMGYKKKCLEEAFASDDGEDDGEKKKKKRQFTPTGCLIMPTLDRGVKMFGVKGYESGVVGEYLGSNNGNGISNVGGFYTNGVLGGIDEMNKECMLHGSASLYVVFGSRSQRPIYTPPPPTTTNEITSPTTTTPSPTTTSSSSSTTPAPRLPNGELLLKRREVHSGRAIFVSTVEWSVAEKTATPTSVLEGYMWDKETEVDRFRERVPLQNLVSQVKLSTVDPSMVKPRDWMSAAVGTEGSSSSSFAIIPECKRIDPVAIKTSLRSRYDAATLASQFVAGGASAIAVSVDPILFGGSLDDIAAIRKSVSDDVPILANDLVLYPYQLYKLRLGGADAVSLLVGALEEKDLKYLTTIGKSLGMQMILTVTSEEQLKKIMRAGVSPKSVDGVCVSNRILETFGFDDTGKQVLELLESEGLKEVREVLDVKVLVEGRVGIVEDGDGGVEGYVKILKELGADGCVMGGALAVLDEEDGGRAYEKVLGYIE